MIEATQVGPHGKQLLTDWIKEGVLRDHNIEVEFVPVPRWTKWKC